MMTLIDMADGEVNIDAAVIASDLELDPAAVLEEMRSGRLTSRWERGVDKDAGRYRVTFFHGSRRLSLIVDADGQVLERSLRQPRGLRAEMVTGTRRA
ncbi:MAG TPA: DUF6522 family protein [Steroidobacteraceae bacterium]|nr:DUF6522 family protein [Steroidobacteraceae bacterium]